MKNRLFAFVAAVLLCVTLTVCAFAGESRIVDDAGKLSESEISSLESTLDSVAEKHSLEIAIVTTESLGEKSAMEYADDKFESMYGDKDGVLLLISTGDGAGDGAWYISTCGKGITIFTDAGIEYISDKIVSHLEKDKYNDAFNEFAQLCDEFATQAETGEPFDSNNLPHEPLSGVWIIIAVVVGFLIALMVVGNMKSKLKTVRSQSGAANYVREGSMNVTGSRDLYLYRTVTRVKKAENNNSSGSSTHTSSSGTTHGGGGGKF